MEEILCEAILILTALTVGWGTYLFFSLSSRFLGQNIWDEMDDTSENVEIEWDARNNKEGMK